MAVPGQQCQVEVCQEITKCGKRSRLPQSRPLRSEFSSMLHRTDGVELWRSRHGRRELLSFILAGELQRRYGILIPYSKLRTGHHCAMDVLRLIITVRVL